MDHEFKIYCGGKFITTNDSVEVINSFDNSLVGTTFLANATHLEDAIVMANQAFLLQKQMPSHVKTRILNEIASLLILQKQEISMVLAAEANKPLKWAMAEVDRSVQTFKVAAEEAGRVQAEYITIDRTAACSPRPRDRRRRLGDLSGRDKRLGIRDPRISAKAEPGAENAASQSLISYL
jgi:glyceraldehyde-3-phosphate dehydrogenase (NADP+)